MSFFDQGGQQPQPTIDPRGGFQQWRRTASGVTELLIQDPDNPRRSIWVPALWNPTIDLLVPIDPKYRAPGETYPARRWASSFADSNGGLDFSGPLDLPLPDDGSGTLQSSIQLPSLTRPGSSGNQTTVLLVVGAVFVIYLMSR